MCWVQSIIHCQCLSSSFQLCDSVSNAIQLCEQQQLSEYSIVTALPSVPAAEPATQNIEYRTNTQQRVEH